MDRAASLERLNSHALTLLVILFYFYEQTADLCLFSLLFVLHQNLRLTEYKEAAEQKRWKRWEWWVAGWREEAYFEEAYF